MVILSIETKKLIYDGLGSIMNLDALDWNVLNNDIKIKILHNFLGFFLFNTLFTNSCLNIPIKSLKPKKLIMYCNFNKKNNLTIFNTFNKNILNYTYNFRNDFIKNKIFYTFSSMPLDTFNKIIEDYNTIVYNTINDNLNFINLELLYNSLLNNNVNKAINNNKLTFNITKNKNELTINFNDNIVINLSLLINKNKITNNIPVFYKINLINKF